MRKLLICTPLGTFSQFRYIFYIFLSDYNSGTIPDIKFKFSAFLSFVKTTKCIFKVLGAQVLKLTFSI